MPSQYRTAATLAAALALAGCASLPRERGYAETGALIEARRDVVPRGSPAATELPAELPSAPISAEDAVRLAFFNNPHIREEYARLGLGRAELEEARRIANPSFGYARLSSREGGSPRITRNLSLGLTDLLLLPARKRFAQGELERLQNAVAGALLELATQVEEAWYRAVGAQQIAAMRDVVAQAAAHSTDLAQRFFDAGNITRLQLEQENAAASQARIDAVRASAEALRARSTLAGLIGLPSSAAWTTQTQLPAPPTALPSADALIPVALEQRLDLAAARQAVVLREDALGVTRRWRWLGSIEVGIEDERESGGEVLRGPSLALALPIFNQGQGALARAQAELMRARAELDALVLNVHNTARLGVEQLAVAREISERYRTELVPRREAIVARTQERVNFMLVGVFELLLARQQEYDAYQAYLEAVRDYWTARAELRGAVGGRLPDDDQALEPTLGVDAILPPTQAPPREHHHHAAPTDDPHAGHAMPATTDSEKANADEATPTDPHAGHTMPPPAAEPDPHAGHRLPPVEDDDREPSDEDASDTDEHPSHDHGDTP